MSAVTRHVRAAAATWLEGTRYTHEHFSSVDPSQFVGRVPAVAFREAEAVLVEALPSLLLVAEKFAAMVDPTVSEADRA